MSWDFWGTVLLFALVAFGLAWPICARLEFDPAEKIAASVAFSLCGVFLAAWVVYVFTLPTGLLWCLPVFAAGGIIWQHRFLRSPFHDPDVRRLCAGQLIVTAWCLGWLALVSSYSGGGWVGDWFEHWARTQFFLEHGATDSLFLGHYPLTARPPLANVVIGAFLRLSRDDFAHYQIVTTLFGSLAFLPAALLARRFGGARNAFALLTVFFMVNPLFVQNATFAWTKLPTAFFVLTALYFFWRTLDRDHSPGAAVLCAATIAAGVLAHYSAGPYAAILAIAWLVAGWSRRTEASWKRDTTLAIFVGAALLAIWFGWAFAVYGVRGTLSTNSSVTGTATTLSSQLSTIAQNLRDTLVPHFLRPVDGALIAQPSVWGKGRDWWFQLYQLNLFFAFGSIAWLALLAILRSLAREAPKRKRLLVGAMLVGTIVLGLVVHGPRDTWGLVHICLQPLVLLGLALLAGRWGTLSRVWRIALIAGATLDFCLGILLHFAVQNHLVSQWLNSARPAPAWTLSYNEGATMNLAAKLQHGLAFFGDAVPASPLLLLALLGGLLTWALVRSSSAPT